jgi:hypothetical protein
MTQQKINNEIYEERYKRYVMDDKVKNQKRINHIFDVLNKFNDMDSNHCSWVLKQIEDMNFKENYKETK